MTDCLIYCRNTKTIVVANFACTPHTLSQFDLLQQAHQLQVPLMPNHANSKCLQVPLAARMFGSKSTQVNRHQTRQTSSLAQQLPNGGVSCISFSLRFFYLSASLPVPLQLLALPPCHEVSPLPQPALCSPFARVLLFYHLACTSDSNNISLEPDM